MEKTTTNKEIDEQIYLSGHVIDLENEIDKLKQEKSTNNLKLWRLINHLTNVNPNYTTKYFKAIMDGKLPDDVMHLNNQRFTSETTDTGVYYYENDVRLPEEQFWNTICRLEREIDDLKEDKNRYKRERDNVRKELELALETIDGMKAYCMLKQKGYIIDKEND